MAFVALTALAAMLPGASVSAETAADKAMAQRIGSVLKESGRLRDYRIGVKYQDGVAWLTGTVTSIEQRDAAYRLAQQVDGVQHVVCQVQFPNNDIAASAENAADLHGAFDQVNPAAASNRPRSSGVVNAYANTSANNGAAVGMPRGQRLPAVARSNQGLRRTRPTARNNMPLPSRRIPMNQPIRQVSAQGVYPAGGHCPPGAEMGGAGAYPPGAGMGGGPMMGGGMGPVPVGFIHSGAGRGPSYDNAQMPGYSWPSYASYPNYAALTYPQQYSPTAWPYIGPFYPYPQVPLAWRKVSLEWDDGWWFLDFSAHNSSH
jgi:hypothetical protein